MADTSEARMDVVEEPSAGAAAAETEGRRPKRERNEMKRFNPVVEKKEKKEKKQVSKS